MMINNNLALLSLAQCPYLGPKKIAFLEKIFPCLGELFNIGVEELTKVGLSLEWSNKFIKWRQKFYLPELLNTLDQEKISYLSWHDDRYPDLLKEISSPPPIIFYRGDISLLNKRKRLAIVGSRKNTPYAERVLQNFLPELIKYEIIIISGLALGVDSLAHQQTLLNSGLTIAILGSGLKKKNIYPASNRLLAQEIIINGGLVISEFPPDCPAKKENFPRRNRLISGLAQAVLVVEAAAKSGSLITARLALEQNRDVLAIPGNIFLASSAGVNQLIKEGAAPIMAATDILENLNIELVPANQTSKLSSAAHYQPKDYLEAAIYKTILEAEIIGESVSLDEISKKTKLDTATINSKLSILEIKKVVINRNGYFNLSL
jgi:DNA processing protein